MMMTYLIRIRRRLFTFTDAAEAAKAAVLRRKGSGGEHKRMKIGNVWFSNFEIRDRQKPDGSLFRFI